MYPYDGYSAGGGAGYPPGRTASGSIEAVSTAVGAAVGKAMGTLRGRATSARGVGLVAEGGGYVGGGASAGGMPRSSGMVGMGNYDPSKVCVCSLVFGLGTACLAGVELVCQRREAGGFITRGGLLLDFHYCALSRAFKTPLFFSS